MANTYQRLPTSSPPRTVSPPTDSSPSAATSVSDTPHDEDSYRPLRASIQAEFNRPPPAWWKRAGIICILVFSIWLSFKLGNWGYSSPDQPQMIYATRYSDEFKYRPAASPVITDYLKDGRIRLRGASVGGVGVREEDLPTSPEKERAEEKKRLEEAREAAKARMGLKTSKGRKRKGKGKPKSEI